MARGGSTAGHLGGGGGGGRRLGYTVDPILGSCFVVRENVIHRHSFVVSGADFQISLIRLI